MVLKRKLPSRQNPDAADKAADTGAPIDLSTTDFSAEPAKNTAPDQNSGNKDTDSFTADALKEAAAAMAEEMSDSRPKNDLYLDDPFSDISPTNHTPKSQTPPSQTAPEKPMVDVFADLDDIPAAKPQEPKVEAPTEAPKIDTTPEPEVTAAPAPKEEKKETAPAARTTTDIDLSTPNKMKRNKRNKRTRGAALATEAQAAPTDTKQSSPEAAAATATFAAKKEAASTEASTAKAAATDTPDMELAAHNKKDDATTKAEVERAIKEMSGAVPDPAEQEIEAAYLNPAEVNPEFLASAPKPDVSKLLAAETEHTETPETKAEEAKPEGTPKADITPEDASSFDLPTSFADTQEPKVTDSDTAASIETPDATPFPEPDVAPKVEEPKAAVTPEPESKSEPTATKEDTFTAPTNFAEISETDKKIAPLPWEEDAVNNETAELNGDDWQIDAPATPLPPTPDFYAPATDTAAEITAQNDSSNAQPPTSSATTTSDPTNPTDAQQTPTQTPYKDKLNTLPLAFLQAKKDDKDTKSAPPELPGSANTTGNIDTKKPINIKAIAMFAAACIILFVGVKLFQGKDKTQERVARFTGALSETTEKLPKELGGNQNIQKDTLIQPERIVTSSELDKLNKELEEDLALLNPPSAQTPEPSSQIDFVDVTKDEANTPIIADSDAPIPGEQGFVASLQNAIKNERQKQGGQTEQKSEQKQPSSGSPEERLEESQDLQQQVEAELAAYRQALAQSNPNLPIKPNEFFASVNENGVLLPPKTRAPAGANGLPPSEIYTENPYNLPVIAEPETDPVQTVRTLDSFDVALFEPPKNKVRIPKGLKPRLRASDFPELSVLSLVPNKGLIAHTNGREGVLLIGESLEGWELFAVTAQHAEFRSGQRKFYVNAEQ